MIRRSPPVRSKFILRALPLVAWPDEADGFGAVTVRCSRELARQLGDDIAGLINAF
jgi:hypothetical protein